MTKPRPRQKQRKPQFSFRVNPETLRVLELEARRQDRTLSWLVNHVLEQWVAAMLPPHKVRRMEAEQQAAPSVSASTREAD